jgi:hypothetical protein
MHISSCWASDSGSHLTRGDETSAEHFRVRGEPSGGVCSPAGLMGVGVCALSSCVCGVSVTRVKCIGMCAMCVWCFSYSCKVHRYVRAFIATGISFFRLVCLFFDSHRVAIRLRQFVCFSTCTSCKKGRVRVKLYVHGVDRCVCGFVHATVVVRFACLDRVYADHSFGFL